MIKNTKLNNSITFNLFKPGCSFSNKNRTFHTSVELKLDPRNWEIIWDWKKKSIKVNINKLLVEESVQMIVDKVWESYESQPQNIIINKAELKDIIIRMALYQEKCLFIPNDHEVFLNCIAREDLEKMMRGLHYCLKNDPTCADELEELESLTVEEQQKYLENSITEEFLEILTEAFHEDDDNEDDNLG